MLGRQMQCGIRSLSDTSTRSAVGTKIRSFDRESITLSLVNTFPGFFVLLSRIYVFCFVTSHKKDKRKRSPLADFR